MMASGHLRSDRGIGYFVQHVCRRHHAARGGPKYRHQPHPGLDRSQSSDKHYAPHHVSLGFVEPQALALDSSGNLYVANELNNTVTAFAAGSTVVRAMYSAGLYDPIALAFDASGNLYVASEQTTWCSSLPGRHHDAHVPCRAGRTRCPGV